MEVLLALIDYWVLAAVHLHMAYNSVSLSFAVEKKIFLNPNACRISEEIVQ